MQEPERPAHPPRPTLPATGNQVPPRPGHPPTGALPVLPLADLSDAAAGEPRNDDAAQPAPAAQPSPAAPAAPVRPLAAPSAPAALADFAEADAPEADTPRTDALARTEPGDVEPLPVDTSPAAALRSAVLGVPGVLTVGEPASRAIGKLRSAIGKPDAAGVIVTEGTEQMAVDIAIVASITRPLRDTAHAAQRAALEALQDSGRAVVEVNVEVLDAQTQQPTVLSLAAEPGPAVEQGSAPINGHIRVSSKALRSAAAELAQEFFQVPAARVGVNLSDEAGELALRLNLPLPVAPLLESNGASGPSLRERALTQRAPLRRRFGEVTGTVLSRVDVRVTGHLDAQQLAASNGGQA